MDEEEAKAIQEVAKAGGKAIDASVAAGRALARYLGGPIEDAVGIAHDWIKMTRWRNQIRLLQRADEFLRRNGLSAPTRPVPIKVAVPLLQHATLEDDERMQDKWAALLANAANAGSKLDVTPSLVNILSQLSPLEAQILDTIFALPFDESRNAGVVTEGLPGSARVLAQGESAYRSPTEPVRLAISNLVRLGCLRMPATWGGGEAFGSVNPTALGRELVQACTPPDEKLPG
jgi:hypothetical protein